MADEVPVEEIAHELPRSLRIFLQFEQCNLWKPERFRAVSGDSEEVLRFAPERRMAFALPHFVMRRRHLFVYGQRDFCRGVGLSEGESQEDYVSFPVHPGELYKYSELMATVGAHEFTGPGRRVWATPTSSIRTLLAWPDGQPERAFFVKLSLHSRVLGDRRLTRAKVAGSIGVSHAIQQCLGKLPAGISYFLEPCGLTPRRMPDGGVLFRSIPRDIREGSVVPAPLFALMGGSVGHRPVYLQLMERERIDALEVLKDVLLRKFARIWVDLTFDFGFILEAHAQDLLLALSPELVPLGDLYYRDFEGLSVDWALRRAKDLPGSEVMPHACEWFSTYETWGYPLYQMVAIKLRASLFDYLYFVLGEMESALRGWQESGVLTRARVCEGELTFLFSRNLRSAIQDKFGISEREEYDVRRHLNRFVKFLMQVRREVVRAFVGRARGSGSEFGVHLAHF